MLDAMCLQYLTDRSSGVLSMDEDNCETSIVLGTS